MIVRPYLIVPKLIPQPTWGGSYIAIYKNLDQNTFGTMKIGQSYELSTETNLSDELNSSTLPLEIGDAKTGQILEVVGSTHHTFSLQSLIDQDPAAVLGKRVVDTFGERMKVLIKFTQAKGNSFQVHVKPGVQLEHWLPKPESWYFLEQGKATLGLKKGVDLAGYATVCSAIEAKAAELVGSKMDLEAIRKELIEFVNANSPYQYVNEVVVPAGTVIDLSGGGFHHSWEEGDEIPNGNIVYEVQQNVMDNDCTIRSFDKGKMNDDRTVRPVHIQSYMKALDTDETYNDPKAHMKSVMSHSEDGVELAHVFQTPYYSTSMLTIDREYHGKETTTDVSQSFHHLFVLKGIVEIETNTGKLSLAKGGSAFIPANTGVYTLRCDSPAVVLKTWV